MKPCNTRISPVVGLDRDKDLGDVGHAPRVSGGRTVRKECAERAARVHSVHHPTRCPMERLGQSQARDRSLPNPARKRIEPAISGQGESATGRLVKTWKIAEKRLGTRPLGPEPAGLSGGNHNSV